MNVLLGCEKGGKYRKYKKVFGSRRKWYKKMLLSFNLRDKPARNGESWMLKVNMWESNLPRLLFELIYHRRPCLSTSHLDCLSHIKVTKNQHLLLSILVHKSNYLEVIKNFYGKWYFNTVFIYTSIWHRDMTKKRIF